MGMQGAQAGLTHRMVYRFVALAGQTLFSGLDARGFVMTYTPGFADVYVSGTLLTEGRDYTATDGNAIVLTASAPALPAGAELRVIAWPVFNAANTYTQNQSDALFTRKRNRITDPGMRVSQENGNNLLVLSNLTSVYASDSVYALRAGGGGATVQRVLSVTPGGSPFRTRVTVTTANATPGAGDVLVLETRIEGLDVADLKFGTTAARSITIRFGLRSSAAGNIPVALRNGSANRSWLGSVSIAANEVGVDVVKTVTLVGDQVGTWAVDNTLGLDLILTLSSGASNVGVPGWQAGNVVSLAGSLNLMAVNGASFDLFDVGLYEGNVLPPFELASYDDDLRKCQKYFTNGTHAFGNFTVASTNTMSWPWFYPVPMRVLPTLTFSDLSSSGAQGLVRDTRQFSLFLVSKYSGQDNSLTFSYAANARL